MAEEEQREDQEDVRGDMSFAFLGGYEGDIFQRH